MTMLNTNIRDVYTSTGVTSFSYTFKIYADAHIKVIVADSDGQNPITKTLGVDYTVFGAGVSSGGSVIFTVAPDVGKKVILALDAPFTQEGDFLTADALPAETLEQTLDLIVSEVNTLRARVGRAPLLPESTPNTTGLALPDYNITANQNKFLKLTASGLDVATVGTDAIANPLTTKGDLLGRDATAPIRVPVGTNDYVLTADSTDSKGLAWKSLDTNPAITNLATNISNVQGNPIINGAFEIWQRGTTFAAIASGSYSADRWKREGTSAAVFTVNRSTNVPTVAQAGVLLNYSLEVDVTTADATVAAGDNDAIVQRVEGYNWRHFAQRQFTLSFWVMSTKTGTHCVCFRNSGDDRSYVATYSVSASDTWEYKTVTIAASPSAGTWNYNNGTGVAIGWCLMAGSTFQTTAGAWQTGLFTGTSAQVNCLDSTSNFFRLAAVRMEVGAVATVQQFADFATETRRCERYYQKSFNYATTPATNIGVDTGEFVFPQTVAASTTFNTVMIPLKSIMRAGPSSTFFNPSAANSQVRNTNIGADCSGTTSNNTSDRQVGVTANAPAASATAQTLRVHWAMDAEL